MKKSILTLGTLTTILAPIVVVISCGENEETQPQKTTKTTNPGITTPTKLQTVPLTIAQWKVKYPQYASKIIQGTIIADFIDISLPQGFSIPDGITSISNTAFGNVTFNSDLVIPDSVTLIDFGAFINTTFNKKLILSNKLTSINNYAFKNAVFNSDLVIPNSVTSIGWDAFDLIKIIDPNGSTNTNYHWEDTNGNKITHPIAGGKLVID